MLISFQNTPYNNYKVTQNRTFGAYCYFARARRIQWYLAGPKKDEIKQALISLKKYFKSGSIVKEKIPIPDSNKVKRIFYLELPSGYRKELLEICHKWNDNDLIQLGKKIEELAKHKSKPVTKSGDKSFRIFVK